MDCYGGYEMLQSPRVTETQRVIPWVGSVSHQRTCKLCSSITCSDSNNKCDSPLKKKSTTDYHLLNAVRKTHYNITNSPTTPSTIICRVCEPVIPSVHCDTGNASLNQSDSIVKCDRFKNEDFSEDYELNPKYISINESNDTPVIVTDFKFPGNHDNQTVDVSHEHKLHNWGSSDGWDENNRPYLSEHPKQLSEDISLNSVQLMVSQHVSLDSMGCEDFMYNSNDTTLNSHKKNDTDITISDFLQDSIFSPRLPVVSSSNFLFNKPLNKSRHRLKSFTMGDSFGRIEEQQNNNDIIRHAESDGLPEFSDTIHLESLLFDQTCNTPPDEITPINTSSGINLFSAADYSYARRFLSAFHQWKYDVGSTICGYLHNVKNWTGLGGEEFLTQGFIPSTSRVYLLGQPFFLNKHHIEYRLIDSIHSPPFQLQQCIDLNKKQFSQKISSSSMSGSCYHHLNIPTSNPTPFVSIPTSDHFLNHVDRSRSATPAPRSSSAEPVRRARTFSEKYDIPDVFYGICNSVSSKKRSKLFKIEAKKVQRALEKTIHSLTFMSYRRDFLPMYRLGEYQTTSINTSSDGLIPEDLNVIRITSDAGWGCTIRCAQMLLFETLKRHFMIKHDNLLCLDSMINQHPSVSSQNDDSSSVSFLSDTPCLHTCHHLNSLYQTHNSDNHRQVKQLTCKRHQPTTIPTTTTICMTELPVDNHLLVTPYRIQDPLLNMNVCPYVPHSTKPTPLPCSIPSSFISLKTQVNKSASSKNGFLSWSPMTCLADNIMNTQTDTKNTTDYMYYNTDTLMSKDINQFQLTYHLKCVNKNNLTIPSLQLKQYRHHTSTVLKRRKKKLKYKNGHPTRDSPLFTHFITSNRCPSLLLNEQDTHHCFLTESDLLELFLDRPSPPSKYPFSVYSFVRSAGGGIGWASSLYGPMPLETLIMSSLSNNYSHLQRGINHYDYKTNLKLYKKRYYRPYHTHYHFKQSLKNSFLLQHHYSKHRFNVLYHQKSFMCLKSLFRNPTIYARYIYFKTFSGHPLCFKTTKRKLKCHWKHQQCLVLKTHYPKRQQSLLVNRYSSSKHYQTNTLIPSFNNSQLSSLVLNTDDYLNDTLLTHHNSQKTQLSDRQTHYSGLSYSGSVTSEIADHSLPCHYLPGRRSNSEIYLGNNSMADLHQDIHCQTITTDQSVNHSHPINHVSHLSLGQHHSIKKKHTFIHRRHAYKRQFKNNHSDIYMLQDKLMFFGKRPGDWFGPATASYSIQYLVNSCRLTKDSLAVYVNPDGFLDLKDIKSLMNVSYLKHLSYKKTHENAPNNKIYKRHSLRQCFNHPMAYGNTRVSPPIIVKKETTKLINFKQHNVTQPIESGTQLHLGKRNHNVHTRHSFDDPTKLMESLDYIDGSDSDDWHVLQDSSFESLNQLDSLSVQKKKYLFTKQLTSGHSSNYLHYSRQHLKQKRLIPSVSIASTIDVPLVKSTHSIKNEFLNTFSHHLPSSNNKSRISIKQHMKVQPSLINLNDHHQEKGILICFPLTLGSSRFLNVVYHPSISKYFEFPWFVGAIGSKAGKHQAFYFVGKHERSRTNDQPMSPRRHKERLTSSIISDDITNTITPNITPINPLITHDIRVHMPTLNNDVDLSDIHEPFFNLPSNLTSTTTATSRQSVTMKNDYQTIPSIKETPLCMETSIPFDSPTQCHHTDAINTTELLYLDPHIVQGCATDVTLDWDSFHHPKLFRAPATLLDPGLLIAFYCPNFAAVKELSQRLISVGDSDKNAPLTSSQCETLLKTAYTPMHVESNKKKKKRCHLQLHLLKRKSNSLLHHCPKISCKLLSNTNKMTTPIRHTTQHYHHTKLSSMIDPRLCSDTLFVDPLINNYTVNKQESTFKDTIQSNSLINSTTALSILQSSRLPVTEPSVINTIPNQCVYNKAQLRSKIMSPKRQKYFQPYHLRQNKLNILKSFCFSKRSSNHSIKLYPSQRSLSPSWRYNHIHYQLPQESRCQQTTLRRACSTDIPSSTNLKLFKTTHQLGTRERHNSDGFVELSGSDSPKSDFLLLTPPHRVTQSPYYTHLNQSSFQCIPSTTETIHDPRHSQTCSSNNVVLPYTSSIFQHQSTQCNIKQETPRLHQPQHQQLTLCNTSHTLSLIPSTVSATPSLLSTVELRHTHTHCPPVLTRTRCVSINHGRHSPILNYLESLPSRSTIDSSQSSNLLHTMSS